MVAFFSGLTRLYSACSCGSTGAAPHGATVPEAHICAASFGKARPFSIEME
jgi:hypothetical protein